MTSDYLIILLALLQIGDVYTTHRVLSKGGKELNPVVAKLIAMLGLLPGLLLPKALYMGLLLHYQSMVPVELLWLICVVYAWVVWHNYAVLSK